MKLSSRGMIAMMMLLLNGGCTLGSPEGTVKKFFTAAGQGEVDTATELLSARARSIGKEKVRTAIQKYASDATDKGGVESVVVENLVINGQVASAVAVTKFRNGSFSRENVHLVKEDNQWKIDIHK